MIVEATKIKEGFLIPLIGRLQGIEQEKVFLDVELVEQPQTDDLYAALDQLVGLCETTVADASVNHDRIIYATRVGDGIR